MQEIRFHGRGGQGTVVASMLLAKAFFKSGFFVQSFPAFGVERRGAPVEAYLRIDRRPVRIRAQVSRPDHVLVQDHRLLDGVQVTAGLRPDGWILVNTDGGEGLNGRFPGFRIAAVDATRIAQSHRLGTRTHPFINTAMIGAMARILNAPPMEALTDAIREDIPVQPDENIRAAEDAFAAVRLFANKGRTNDA